MLWLMLLTSPWKDISKTHALSFLVSFVFIPMIYMIYTRNCWIVFDECWFVIGESGAGKTEASKVIMNYIASITNVSARAEVKLFLCPLVFLWSFSTSGILFLLSLRFLYGFILLKLCFPTFLTNVKIYIICSTLDKNMSSLQHPGKTGSIW